MELIKINYLNSSDSLTFIDNIKLLINNYRNLFIFRNYFIINIELLKYYNLNYRIYQDNIYIYRKLNFNINNDFSIGINLRYINPSNDFKYFIYGVFYYSEDGPLYGEKIENFDRETFEEIINNIEVMEFILKKNIFIKLR